LEIRGLSYEKNPLPIQLEVEPSEVADAFAKHFHLVYETH
jgi:hypothetical protein